MRPQQLRAEAGALGKHCFEHVGIDVAFDLRRPADAEERHRIKIGGRERYAHLADALRVDADLESQAVGAADQFARAGHGDKARAAKLVRMVLATVRSVIRDCSLVCRIRHPLGDTHALATTAQTQQ